MVVKEFRLLHANPLAKVHMMRNIGIPNPHANTPSGEATSAKRWRRAEYTRPPEDAACGVVEVRWRILQIYRQHPRQAGHPLGCRQWHHGVGSPEGLYHLHFAQAEPHQRGGHLGRRGVGRIANHHPRSIRARLGVPWDAGLCRSCQTKRSATLRGVAMGL